MIPRFTTRSSLRPVTVYAAIIEKAEDGTYSAYVPDLPGCVTAGDSLEEVEAGIRDAVRLHIESMRRHGDPVPRPSAIVTSVPAY